MYESGANTTVNSNDITRVLRIAPDMYPYNYVTCSQAQILANEKSTENYISSLLYGIQYDLIVKYIEENSSLSYSQIYEDSSNWGNQQNSEFEITKGKYFDYRQSNWHEVSNSFKKTASQRYLLTTGVTSRNSILNIFELAGNAREWTLEFTELYEGNSVNIVVGCAQTNTPINTRYGNPVDYSSWGIGFRTTIFSTK